MRRPHTREQIIESLDSLKRELRKEMKRLFDDVDYWQLFGNDPSQRRAVLDDYVIDRNG